MDPASLADPPLPATKTYLYVPYEERLQAKNMGARYDPDKRQWYAPCGQPRLIERWGFTARSQARVYLEVPFADNDLARSMGARWDRRAKKWYDTSDDKHLTQRWKVAEPSGSNADKHSASTSLPPGTRT